MCVAGRSWPFTVLGRAPDGTPPLVTFSVTAQNAKRCTIPGGWGEGLDRERALAGDWGVGHSFGDCGWLGEARSATRIAGKLLYLLGKLKGQFVRSVAVGIK